MVDDNDNSKDYKERKDKSYYKIESERIVIIIKDSERGIENMIYISVRGRININ